MAVAAPSPTRRRGLRRGLRERTDEQLAAALRTGDAGAFNELYERHHRPLLAFCRHMLGSREEAEDALQMVFVSAHTRLLEPDSVAAVRAFLYAVARNRCLSVLRARRDVVALSAVAEPATDGLALEAEVESRQDLRELLSDLALLPPEQRAALVLAELQDLAHDEIAVALDVRTDKVKALVFQAREALMARRTARGADCAVIQEQLSSLRGSALRRSSLRRHVEVCGACASFEAEVGRQRAAFAMILPVVPTLALKDGVFAALTSGGATAAGAGVASTAGVFGGAGAVAKGAAVLALAGGTVGGGAALVAREDPPAPKGRTAAPARPVTPAASLVAPGSGRVTVVVPTAAELAERRRDAGRTTAKNKASKPGARGRSALAKAAAVARRERARAAARERAAARRAAKAASRLARPAPTTRGGQASAKAVEPTRAASRSGVVAAKPKEAPTGENATVAPRVTRPSGGKGKSPKADSSVE